MPDISVPMPFVRGLLRGAEISGLNLEPLFDELGIKPSILAGSEGAISVDNFTHLGESLARLMRDEIWGLAEKPQAPGTFRLMRYACSQGRTLGESLAICAGFFNLFENSLKFSYIENRSGGTLRLARLANHLVLSNYLIEGTLSLIHRFHCWLAGEFVRIEQVQLDFPEPDYRDQYRFMFYGAPVLFNQKTNAIRLNKASVSLANIRSRDEISALDKRVGATLLHQTRSSRSLAVRLRHWMENSLREQQIPQLAEAAEHLGLEPQTLRRRLKKEGYSFQQVKDETRRDMAIEFLQGRALSVEQISQALGFSEASTFIRAFKTWTGSTPLRFLGSVTNVNHS